MNRLLSVIIVLSCGTGQPPNETVTARGPAEVSPAQDARDATQTATNWIDFDFYRDSRVFLPVSVDGYETVAALDSGAGMTAIDLTLAKAAGLEGSGQFNATGTGGSTTVQLANGVTIAVGDVVLNNMTVAILDLSGVADRLLGRPLPMILGVEVFNKMVVDIDYPRRRLAFHEPEEWHYDGNGHVVPLISSGGGRAVRIRVEGGEPILAGFDIGQGAPLTILKHHADATELLAGRMSGTVRTGGVGGATIDRITTVESVEWEGIHFDRVPTMVPTQAVGAFNTRQREANIGTGIFSRFRMITDYSRDRLVLEADPSLGPGAFQRNRAGVYFERKTQGLEIAHVSEGSPAHEAGMRAGDIVTDIDGEPVESDYWSGDLWRWSAAPAGTRVGITLASGKTFAFTLEDYY